MAREPLNLRLQSWLTSRWQAREGWLLLVLFLLVNSVVQSLLRAAWTPELALLPTTAVFALVLSILLAKEPISPWRAWIWIVAYGVVVTAGRAANVLPTAVFRLGWAEYQATARLNWAAYSTRLAGWWQVTQRGEATEETAVFTLILLLLVWLLAAYAGWATLRNRQPLLAVLLLAAVVGINAFFSLMTLWSLLRFAAFALLLLAVARSVELEMDWQAGGVQFSLDVRRRMWQTLGVITAVLLLGAYRFWEVERTAVALAFAESQLAQTVEAWLDTSLAGVNRSRLGSEWANPVGGAGALPRSFLLGDSPELYETVMMTAQTDQLTGGEPRAIRHWRAVSYDVYTGRGWSISESIAQPTKANLPLTLQTIAATAIVSQTISWEFDRRATRFTLGIPRSFGHDTVSQHRLSDDIAWVEGGQLAYTALSAVSTATPAQLNQVTLDQIDPEIRQRYTALPADLPQRVVDLAESLHAPEMTPYQQARVIEAFVQQYPYSLQVNPPPADSDVVDFFLFEQQAGYCDYYASAMVVLARQLGLPARLASGFVVKEPNDAGVQTIYQIDGHSWAEIHFGEYGWIEFEPTAGFSGGVGETETAVSDPEIGVDDIPATLPIPPPQPPAALGSGIWLAWAFGVAVLLGGTLIIWIGRRNLEQLSLEAQYVQLQRGAGWLQLSLPSSYTPLEFDTQWQTHLALLAQQNGRFPFIQTALTELQQTSAYVLLAYNQALYSNQAKPVSAAGWPRTYWLLWLLRSYFFVAR